MSVAFTPRASDLPEPAAEQYRAMSSLAVVSFVLGLLSVLVFFSWLLGLIPMIGIGCGALALLRIRAQPEALAGETLAIIGTLLSTLFLTVGWGILGYEYLTEVPEGATRISYAQLQPADSAPDVVPPESAKSLDGQHVFIAGYVYPTGKKSGLTQFILCRDNGTCCFGGQPKLTDMIAVTLKYPLKLDYSTRLHKVAGVFRVETVQSNDGVGSVLYQLEADYLQ